MPAKKKRARRKPKKRGGSSTVLYFSLGAVAAAITAAVVTLLRRRNLMARSNQPRMEAPWEPEAEAPSSLPLPAKHPPPSSVTPAPQVLQGPAAQVLTDPGGDPDAAAPASDTRWSRTTKYVVGVGLFAAVVFAVIISRESLRMIVLAALIAFVVRPVIDSLSRRLKNRRGAAIAIVYILVVLLIILIPFLVIPALVQGLNSISVALHEHAAAGLAASIDVLVQNLSANPVLGGGLISPLESLSDLLTQIAAEGPPPLEVTADEAVLTGAMGITLGGLASILGPLIASIVSLVFALLISIQMTIAGDMFRNGALSMVPAAYKPEMTALMNKLGYIWNSFLRGELLLMLVVGLCVWFGNWLIGTPQALALGIIAGLLEVIPSLGPLLAWIPAVILALVFGSTRFTGMDPLVFALLVSAMYGLIQALENQVLVPQILGDAVNLPPVVVLIGVTIFGSLFGILGILIATPTIATLAEIFDYLYDKILEGPAPPPEEDKRSLMDNVRRFIGSFRPPWRRETKHEPAKVEAPVTPVE